MDLDRAEALLRAEGWSTSRQDVPYTGVIVYAFPVGVDDCRIRVTSAGPAVKCMEADLWNRPIEAEAIASALARTVALCRRIEAECQVSAGGQA